MPRSKSVPVKYNKDTHITTTRPAGFGDTMKQGFALGAGQAVAHQAVGSLFTMFRSPEKVAPTPSDCTAYEKCRTKVDKESCDTLYETCAKLD